MPRSGRVCATPRWPLGQSVPLTSSESRISCIHDRPEVSRKRPAVEYGVHLVKIHYPVFTIREVKLVPSLRPQARTQCARPVIGPPQRKHLRHETMIAHVTVMSAHAALGSGVYWPAGVRASLSGLWNTSLM